MLHVSASSAASNTVTLKCPACQTLLRRTDHTPQPGLTYRCQVCRLEFIADRETDKLVLRPLPENSA
jgi:predicted SprT family Zn-dependent metalloprotease